MTVVFPKAQGKADSNSPALQACSESLQRIEASDFFPQAVSFKWNQGK